jgi:uncharacterized phiE125 gp8 family phage protein
MLPTWTTKIITEPAVEPVTLEQVKNHSRITHIEDDSWLLMAMIVARQLIEKTCELSLITQTRQMTFPSFPQNFLTLQNFQPQPLYSYIKLAYGPTISISEIKYYDQTNTLQTLNDYQATLESNPCLIVPGIGKNWPSTIANRLDAVKVTFVAGYGDPENVPAALKQAILLLVDHWYSNRSAIGMGSPGPIPFGVDSLINLFASGNYR